MKLSKPAEKPGGVGHQAVASQRKAGQEGMEESGDGLSSGQE